MAAKAGWGGKVHWGGQAGDWGMAAGRVEGKERVATVGVAAAREAWEEAAGRVVGSEVREGMAVGAMGRGA